MKKILFNNTDLQVSELCLGTANFGTVRSVEESFEQMDIFTEAGGNFIDTALVYGDWGCNGKGRSEKVIGQWMALRKKRDQVILSTKGCHPPAEDMNVPRVNAAEICSDVEKSLGNLQTDHIDLYFLHRDDPSVPVEELLEALEAEVQKGNLRYYGCSNWSLERVKQAAAYAKAHKLQGFVCNQILMALADVDMTSIEWTGMRILDSEFYRYHKENGLNLMAFMCMSGGYFEKVLAGRPISEGQQAMYDSPVNKAILQRMEAFSKEGYEPLDFILRYVTGAAFPAVPIAAFGTKAQLMAAIGSLQKQVPQELCRELSSLKKAQIYSW